MIHITWDPKTETWHHHDRDETFVWGSNHHEISYSGEENDRSIPFQFRHTDHKIGPLVGILTSSRPDKPFIGNIDTFQRMINYVHKAGGLAFIFSEQNIRPSTVEGYTYVIRQRKWLKIEVPLPDFIYNRVPYQNDENQATFKETLSWIAENNIPYFNRTFFSKWDTYLILNANVFLQSFLPETRLIQQKKDVHTMLNKYEQIIIKPLLGSKGRGIFSLERHRRDTIRYFSNQKDKKLTNLDMVWNTLSIQQEPYLIQPLINRLESRNLPFDYRILVQKQGESWSVTGYGLRCAGAGKLTTHVPSGGKIISPKQVPLNPVILKRICYEVGKSLDLALGPIGEFSIDLGVDQNNQYWIFEINSKPMIFDEKNIQKKALRCWYQQVLYLSGFTKPDINPSSHCHTNHEGG